MVVIEMPRIDDDTNYFNKKYGYSASDLLAATQATVTPHKPRPGPCFFQLILSLELTWCAVFSTAESKADYATSAHGKTSQLRVYYSPSRSFTLVCDV